MTTFLRFVDVPVDRKTRELLREIVALRVAGSSDVAFELDPSTFSQVPGTPFSYWVSDRLRSLFHSAQSCLTAKQGLSTVNDFRFARLWWEVVAEPIGSRWFPFAKGGAHSRFYADPHLVVNWHAVGREIYVYNNIPLGFAGAPIRNPDHYFRPGLTWPRRTQGGLGLRAMPAGCIFADKGPAAFVEDDKPNMLLALLAVASSAAFRALVELQMAFGSYEVGVIQRTPVPRLTAADVAALARMARRVWSLKRSLDTANETSHAFVLPVLVHEVDASRVLRELAKLQEQIDDELFRLYEIDSEDRAAVEGAEPAITSESANVDDPDEGGDESSNEEAAAATGPDQLASWLVGVAFARFDPRLATGERAIPPEPEPFDPLPSRSPGMYPEGEEPANRPDILVDDEGHADDLTVRATAIAERVKVDVPENLRSWLAKEFFPLHIKMYSKSRRKAPIYWQLATPSASYSVWLYIHAFSTDTLFRVQNDYVTPKLAHEERRLASLTSELRDGATAAQRKQLAAQETQVEELRAFLDEVKRVAPLWNPNLDDGVIINFAPLWRLVPQNKSWQKELKSTWDALCEGKYDWAHLAMHLWPERVVPKCATDRSLAIAHGLEEVFWVEGADGKWTARKTPTRSVDELVKERTSAAVKSALKSLLEAPVAGGGMNKTKKGRAHA